MSFQSFTRPKLLVVNPPCAVAGPTQASIHTVLDLLVRFKDRNGTEGAVA